LPHAEEISASCSQKEPWAAAFDGDNHAQNRFRVLRIRDSAAAEDSAAAATKERPESRNEVIFFVLAAKQDVE
jgi:hypothetical protein